MISDLIVDIYQNKYTRGVLINGESLFVPIPIHQIPVRRVQLKSTYTRLFLREWLSVPIRIIHKQYMHIF